MKQVRNSQKILPELLKKYIREFLAKISILFI